MKAIIALVIVAAALAALGAPFASAQAPTPTPTPTPTPAPTPAPPFQQVLDQRIVWPEPPATPSWDFDAIPWPYELDRAKPTDPDYGMECDEFTPTYPLTIGARAQGRFDTIIISGWCEGQTFNAYPAQARRESSVYILEQVEAVLVDNGVEVVRVGHSTYLLIRYIVDAGRRGDRADEAVDRNFLHREEVTINITTSHNIEVETRIRAALSKYPCPAGCVNDGQGRGLLIVEVPLEQGLPKTLDAPHFQNSPKTLVSDTGLMTPLPVNGGLDARIIAGLLWVQSDVPVTLVENNRLTREGEGYIQVQGPSYVESGGNLLAANPVPFELTDNAPSAPEQVGELGSAFDVLTDVGDLAGLPQQAAVGAMIAGVAGFLLYRGGVSGAARGASIAAMLSVTVILPLALATRIVLAPGVLAMAMLAVLAIFRRVRKEVPD